LLGGGGSVHFSAAARPWSSSIRRPPLLPVLKYTGDEAVAAQLFDAGAEGVDAEVLKAAHWLFDDRLGPSGPIEEEVEAFAHCVSVPRVGVDSREGASGRSATAAESEP